MSVERTRNRWFRGLLAFSFALVMFSYGMATVQYQIFPYPVLRDAKLAFDALCEIYRPEDRTDGAPAAPPTQGPLPEAPVVRNHAGVVSDDLILVCGGSDYLRTHAPEHGCLAWLVDRQGRVRHVWPYDPTVWSGLNDVHTFPAASVIYPIGLHLYEDGGLLASFQGKSCFPYAVGIARFDRDARLLWKRELFHHWFSVGGDGRIYAPSLRVVESPIRLGNTRAQITTDKRKILSDTVAVLDPAGNPIDEISVLDALVDSGCIGVFQGAMTEPVTPLIDVPTDDPIHLNDVRLVDAALAARVAWLAPGDLLLSMRSINAVGVLDARTRRFKWLVVGRTLRQHSPRFFGEGVLVFDNFGGPHQTGGSRLARIDLASSAVETVFPRPSRSLPSAFFAETAGHLDLSADGNRALIAA
ncbi:MAG: arylsulfotransferase family protein, partial [Thermoguttaceae bacterium]|nr:arylsulfotransferase family protein [Thermoguttaceae bacterium]